MAQSITSYNGLGFAFFHCTASTDSLFLFCFVFVFAFMLLPPIFLICKYTQSLLYQLNCLREITSFTLSQDDLLPVIPYYGYLSWVSRLSLSACFSFLQWTICILSLLWYHFPCIKSLPCITLLSQ